MNLPVLVNVAVFALTLGYLYQRRKGGASIASNVLLSVLLGVVLGVLVQAAYGLGTPGHHRHHDLGRRGRRHLRAAAADGDRAAGLHLDPVGGHQAARRQVARQDQRRRARHAARHHGHLGRHRHRRHHALRPARRRTGARRPRTRTRRLHGDPRRRCCQARPAVAAAVDGADQHLRGPGRHAVHVDHGRGRLRRHARLRGAGAQARETRDRASGCRRASRRCRRSSCGSCAWCCASRPTACWRS